MAMNMNIDIRYNIKDINNPTNAVHIGYCTKLQYLQFERIKRNVNTICLCGKMSIQKYQSISIITISSSIYIITVKLTQRIIDLHMS
jgi:hypothetical protein